MASTEKDSLTVTLFRRFRSIYSPQRMHQVWGDTSPAELEVDWEPELRKLIATDRELIRHTLAELKRGAKDGRSDWPPSLPTFLSTAKNVHNQLDDRRFRPEKFDEPTPQDIARAAKAIKQAEQALAGPPLVDTPSPAGPLDAIEQGIRNESYKAKGEPNKRWAYVGLRDFVIGKTRPSHMQMTMWLSATGYRLVDIERIRDQLSEQRHAKALEAA